MCLKKIKSRVLFKKILNVALEKTRGVKGGVKFSLNGLDVLFSTGWVYPAAALPSFFATSYETIKVFHDGNLVLYGERDDGKFIKIYTFKKGVWEERV